MLEAREWRAIALACAAARQRRPPLDAGAQTASARLPCPRRAVDFHPNGQLVTGGADKEVKVWEVSVLPACWPPLHAH